MRIVYTFKGNEKVFDSEKKQITLGRPKEGVVVDLDLTPDQSVSRPHAQLWEIDGQFWIEDRNSMRGTLINGEEIHGKGRRQLHEGDYIRLGDTMLRVEMPTAREVSASTSQSERETGAAGALERGNVPSVKLSNLEPQVEIEEAIDATVPVFAPLTSRTADFHEQMALLCEIPLQFAAETRLEVLLEIVVKRLLEVIPGAKRGAVLLQDRGTAQLLLKAHLPAGEPSLSVTLARRAMERREGFLWWKGEKPTVSQLEYHMRSGMYAPLVWKGEPLGVVCVDNYETDNAFDSNDLALLLAVGHYAAMAVVQHYLQDDLRRNAVMLGRLLTNFSPKIRDKLLEKARRGRLSLGGEKSEITILCSDIRGFTKMSEGMEADDIMEVLNHYFSGLVEQIFKFDGTIDKFVGDSILAVFGSPEPDPQQHEKAVRAAVAMQSAMRDLNALRGGRGQVTCEIGIGVHCGEVAHGFIGSQERMEFTVIGDAVNRAARFCDGALPGEILLSPEVHQRVWKIAQVEPTTIATKHEGDFRAFHLKGLKV
jgi:adenylate cyclase